MAEARGPADPTAGATALERLAAAHVPLVPAQAGRGRVGSAAWTAESVLPGRRPRRLTPGLVRAVVRFCSSLPRSPQPIVALTEDLAAIGPAIGREPRNLVALGAPALAAIDDLPAVMRHGDLWSGNLLVDADDLRGVVDWDAWHPAAVPATDLLHLLAVDRAGRTGESFGELWLARIWRTEAFERLSEDYWRALDVQPNEGVLAAVGLAWWANQASQSLLRLPHLAEDLEWRSRNLEGVLERLRSGVMP
jgi:hypothetical protein